MKKLIGNVPFTGKSIIVECEDHNAVRRAKHAFARNVGIALVSYDAAIRREAKRLVHRPQDPPEFHF